MVKSLYENICAGRDIRASLIELKQEMKDEDHKRAFVYLLGGDFGELTKLLYHDDAKIRKNAALILGNLECEDVLPDLWKAYENEVQRFVKTAYLKGMAEYDYEAYLPQLKERLLCLGETDAKESEKKHIREEGAALQSLILKYEKPKKHRFIGRDVPTEVILLTNRENREITRMQIETDKTVLLAGGVRVQTADIKALMKIRTFSDMLFPVPGLTLLSEQPQEAAMELAAGGILRFLRSMHKGDEPFFFRTELKGRMPLEKRGQFVKRFSAELEKETDRGMINSASEYEAELRLLEKKEGGFVPLLKLYTLPDKRFAYRRNVLSTSIAPQNAALIMKLAKEWLTEDAQVLDPFCGVGTMLIERNYLKPANPMYGIDIYQDAILKARENAEAANVVINFINRDFLDFRHDYLFDEIVTNMPVVSRTKGMEAIMQLYEDFFERVPEVLKEEGIMLLYTREESVLMHCIKKYGFVEQIKKWIINDREGSKAFLLKRKPD